MLNYRTIVGAVLATVAFTVHAEIPRNPESGPQPAPYGIKDPAPTPVDFKFAVFPQSVDSGPQPLAQVGDPVSARTGRKSVAANAEIPRNPESGPQPAPYGIKDPAPTPADFQFAVFPQNVESGPQQVN